MNRIDLVYKDFKIDELECAKRVTTVARVGE